MVQIALCTALICVGAQLAIPLPIGVPFTLQVLMVMLTALILKPVLADFAAALCSARHYRTARFFGRQERHRHDTLAHGRLHHRLCPRRVFCQPDRQSARQKAERKAHDRALHHLNRAHRHSRDVHTGHRALHGLHGR